jgi:hypothetical protein
MFTQSPDEQVGALPLHEVALNSQLPIEWSGMIFQAYKTAVSDVADVLPYS